MSYILDALKKSDQERRQGELPGVNTLDSSSNAPSTSNPWPWIGVTVVCITALAIVIAAPWSEPESEGGIASDTHSSASEMPRQSADTPPISSPASSGTAPNVSGVADVDAETLARLQRLEAEAAQQAQRQLEQAALAEKAAAEQSALSVTPAPEYSVPPRPKRAQQAAVNTRAPATASSGPAAAPASTQPNQPPQFEQPAQSASVQRSEPQASYIPQLGELSPQLRQRIPDMEFSSHMYSSSARFRSVSINGRRLKEGQFLNDDIRVVEISEKGVILSIDNQPFSVDVLGQWVN